MDYKNNFLAAVVVGVVAFVLYLLVGEDESAKLMSLILGGGTALYFFIEGLIRYLGLKK